jgi:predicted NAD/FAD-binding protein
MSNEPNPSSMASPLPRRRKIAVVGSGIAGLMSAWELTRLSRTLEVTVFESSERCGGHAHTVDITLDGITHGVDTGFLVYNPKTYPGLMALFSELGIEQVPSNMGFSVQVDTPSAHLEWSGNDLNGLFAQRQNVFSWSFFSMLRDLLRFNAKALALSRSLPSDSLPLSSNPKTVGDFLTEHRFGKPFIHHYLLPMIACIWSCPPAQMLEFPLVTLLRFCANHGLLQINNRPTWLTVKGGSKNYVNSLLHGLQERGAKIRRAIPITSIDRNAHRVRIFHPHEPQGEWFDGVVVATHSDQALALLRDGATALERDLLSPIRYQENRAVLHTDIRHMPRSRRAWAAWNYERSVHHDERAQVCLHYWINRLQPLPFNSEVIVSLNPIRPINPATVLGEFGYAHPIFSREAIAAQATISAVHQAAIMQTKTWFAGAWTRYGFHEDGLQSGINAAQSVLRAFHTTTAKGE